MCCYRSDQDVIRNILADWFAVKYRVWAGEDQKSVG